MFDLPDGMLDRFSSNFCLSITFMIPVIIRNIIPFKLSFHYFGSEKKKVLAQLPQILSRLFCLLNVANKQLNNGRYVLLHASKCNFISHFIFVNWKMDA